MRRLSPLAIAFLLTAVAAPTQAAPAVVPPVLEVIGRVTNAARPVADALVIALNLKDLGATQTYSLADGTFSLAKLPAGIYKIIAVKQGFAPAVVTVAPNRASHRVALKLEDEKKKGRPGSEEMWQLRASLPADILREIDQAIAVPVPRQTDAPPRMKGAMVSMTGAGEASDAAFARTSVGVESRITDNWQLDIKGDLHRVDDPTDEERFGSAAAQSSVMSMELRSSAADALRVATSKSYWRYAPNGRLDRNAGVSAHGLEWKHGDARVAVRYLAQENLFASTPFGSDQIEIDGDATVMQTARTDLGVSIRVTQENIRDASVTTLRTADVTASGSVVLIPAFIVRYGVSGRRTLDRTELAPRAGIQWKFSDDASVVVDGMVKAVDPFTEGAILPTIGNSFDDGRLLPRYSVSFGVLSGDKNSSHFSAIATLTAVESPVRIVFNDGYEQFWDGLFIDSGDIRRDVRLSWRTDFRGRLALDITTSAGTATPSQGGGSGKSYVTGDVQSIYFPTGTSLLVSYRELRQPQQQRGEYRSERVNVRMAQSLYLPVDLKLLLGFELARAENSPYLIDAMEHGPNAVSRKYIGGLAVNF